MLLKPLLLCTLIGISLHAYEYDLQPQQVAKDIYCFFGKLESITPENAGNMVNTCYVKTKEGYVVIDSGPTYDYAKETYARMQQIATLPVKYVIATHDHDDHWLGNGFYKSQGALLIGPKTYEQNIIKGMQTRMERILGKEVYGSAGIVPLDKVVEGNMTLRVGEKRFEILQPVHQAHTKGDLIVWIPEISVLFAGHLVFDGRLTSLRDGSLIGSMRAIGKLKAYHPKVVVPGHGYRTQADILKIFQNYLVDLKKSVSEAIDNDVGLEEVTKKVTLPQYSHLKLYNALNARNVSDAYRELEMYDEED